MCLYGKKEKKNKQIQIHTPTKREADLGGAWSRRCNRWKARESAQSEGLKGTNLRRIDPTSCVSKIDLVLQSEINFFFRLRNIVLEIYSCDLFLMLILDRKSVV